MAKEQYFEAMRKILVSAAAELSEGDYEDLLSEMEDEVSARSEALK